MTVSEYFKRIYPHIKSGIFYPSRKNTGIFVTLCFQAAGSNYFTIVKGKRYSSADVPLQRKIFDGTRTMSHEVKSSFGNFDIAGLTGFFESSIDDGKIKDVMMAFGVPASAEIKERALCEALALQMKAFMDSQSDDAEDIVLLEYQRLASVAENANAVQTTSVLYPGDSVYMNSSWRPTYSVSCNEKFQHTWDFCNTGTQTWRGRKLFFSNHKTVRPRAENNYIDIPDVQPGKGIKITASMDARGFEGKTECLWIMVDSEGNNCFPNSSAFTFIVDVTFRFS